MTFDADRKSFEPYRKNAPGKRQLSGALAELTPDDEHAL